MEQVLLTNLLCINQMAAAEQWHRAGKRGRTLHRTVLGHVTVREKWSKPAPGNADGGVVKLEARGGAGYEAKTRSEQCWST